MKKTTKEKKQEKPSKSNQDGYYATFIIAGKRFLSQGNTLSQAIQNLKPDITKAHGILVIEHDGKKYEKILTRVNVMRLFGMGSPFSKEIMTKHILTIFGDI